MTSETNMEDPTTTTAERSEKQREASRANGARSRGPVTADGKATSSQNARTHGLRAKNLVLSNEDCTALEAMIDEYVEEYLPETPTESALVTEMAYAKWRQQRTWISETAAINKQMASDHAAMDETFVHFDESIRTASAIEASLERTGALELYNRAEARFNRQFHRALSTLLAIRKNKKRTNEPENRPC